MAILEVKDLTKNFGSTEVLKGISFELQEGKVLSVIGSSGSGKTTLLRCINGLETATSGKITVNDQVVFDSAITAVHGSRKRYACNEACGKTTSRLQAEEKGIA